MRNRQLLGKWLLIVTCLAMALCLVQRAVMLNHFLQGLEPQIALSADAPSQSNAGESGPSPCQLGAHSLLCAQPLLFDGALPAADHTGVVLAGDLYSVPAANKRG